MLVFIVFLAAVFAVVALRINTRCNSVVADLIGIAASTGLIIIALVLLAIGLSGKETAWPFVTALGTGGWLYVVGLLLREGSVGSRAALAAGATLATVAVIVPSVVTLAMPLVAVQWALLLRHRSRGTTRPTAYEAGRR